MTREIELELYCIDFTIQVYLDEDGAIEELEKVLYKDIDIIDILSEETKKDIINKYYEII